MPHHYTPIPKSQRRYVSNKINKIKEEGVRKNTQAPVSKSNPRRAVSQKKAIAIAINMARRKHKKGGE